MIKRVHSNVLKEYRKYVITFYLMFTSHDIHLARVIFFPLFFTMDTLMSLILSQSRSACNLSPWNRCIIIFIFYLPILAYPAENLFPKSQSLKQAHFKTV